MKKRSKSWSFRRFFVRVFTILLILTVSAVLYLSTYGFPDWMLGGLLRRVDTGSFSFETSRLKLDLSGGFMFSEARVYRKGMLGPPVLSANEVNIMVDPFRMLTGESFVSAIRVKDGEVCTGMACDPESERILITGLDLSFNLLLENCTVDGISAVSVGADIDCSGSVVRVSNMLIRLNTGDRPGTIRGYVNYDDREGAATGHLESNFDPHFIVPYMKERNWTFLVTLVERFDFERAPPRCVVDFTKLLDGHRDFTLKGRAELSESSYRGVDVLRADGTVSIEITDDVKIVRVDPLLVFREEGNARGGFTVDGATGNITYEGVSSIRPIEVIRMLGIYSEQLMGNWRFDGPIVVKSSGFINYKDKAQRKMGLRFEGQGAGIGSCVSEQCSFDMTINGNDVLLTNIVGMVYGGEFSGTAGFVFPSVNGDPTSYNVEGRVNKSDAPRMLRAIWGKDIPDIEGELYMGGSLSGEMGKTFKSSTQGQGYLGVKGQVFALPVFGGLSNLMRKIIPGLDFVLRQGDSKAEFAVNDGKINVSKLRVEGDVLSLDGKGGVGFDRELDFDIQVKLMKAHTAGGKLMRVITYPISKLFEFKLNGSVDEPKWYPVNFSSDLLEKVGLKKALGKQ